MRMIYTDHSNDTVYICRSANTNLTCLENELIKVWFAELAPDETGICPESINDILNVVSGDGCPTRSVLWDVRNICDGRRQCSLTPDSIEAGHECRNSPRWSLLLRLEYSCYGGERLVYNNELLYRWLLIAISALFLLFLLSLLVTIRRVRFLSRMSSSSSQAPLTQLENRHV